MLRRIAWVTLGLSAVLLVTTRLRDSTPAGAPPDGGPTATGPLLDSGVASYYGQGFDGRPTASGELFDRNGMTAAHKTLKLGTVVDVINLDNGLTVRVRINDRGPFVAGRVIDLAEGAARALGYLQAGLANVEIRGVN